ncbi:MAG: PIN domain-containing protein [Thermodesulfovibrionales bacterium]|nr:PIN domain-containing protein [Thermodesulfovibrionales bacterium]
MSIGVKVKYFDTSAIVKLFIDEEGSEYFKNYYINNCNYCCTEMTFYEAFNVLKARLFKGNTKEKYFKSVEDLAIMGWGGKLEIETIQMHDYSVFKEVNDIAIKYNIDVADAIQIYAIIKGKYSFFAADSKTVLITADERLERAGEDNKIRVWNCKKNRPDWLDN